MWKRFASFFLCAIHDRTSPQSNSTGESINLNAFDNRLLSDGATWEKKQRSSKNFLMTENKLLLLLLCQQRTKKFKQPLKFLFLLVWLDRNVSRESEDFFLDVLLICWGISGRMSESYCIYSSDTTLLNFFNHVLWLSSLPYALRRTNWMLFSRSRRP